MTTTKLELNDTELSQLERATRSDKRPEVRQRATALGLLLLGKSPREVAEVLAVSLPTVYNWRARSRSGGLEALANRPKSGRPSVADEAYCRVWEDTLGKEPAELGYEFAPWTVERLKAHLEQATGKRMSANRLRVLLRKLGYRYHRPKDKLTHLQEGEAKEKAAE
ncbi:MAG: helix-turn-helix domain-containing protein [Anaerolineales bacterium]|nr:helix-turn-helix domain-containing protein [Anaerolineales bacterium]MDW8161180.1 helix-turn-helix domain-containing protein [Anaerolineales bacterium]